jgi:hypothetical protein
MGEDVMFGLKRVHIARHERGLLFQERSFAQVLEPGVRWFFDPLSRTEIEVRDLTVPEFEHPQMDFLLAAGGAEHFQVVELEDREVGLVYKNGKIAGVLAPGRRQLYWRGPVDVHVARYDISKDFEIPSGIAKVLARAKQPLAAQVADAVATVEVPDTAIGLLMVDGELMKVLGPGLHAFWKFQRAVRIELVDRRVQAMEVAGQELLTRDWVNLRIGLVALWQVVDVVRARGALTNFVDFAYKELQFALREAVGNRTLDEVLADRGMLDRELGAAAHAKVAEHGLAIHSVGVKDVTLLHTAPLLDESPTLLRMKQLTAAN